jgi:peroxiredoxin Q/BCP
MSLIAGALAPDFSLASDVAGTVHLADLRGAPVVLYFYPKDDTPSCTQEACDFRDRLEGVMAHGAALLGVSRDSVAKHLKFREKYDLTFPLLSDPDGVVHQAYGAWGEKTMYGKVTIGALRTTVLIDAEGKVAESWSRLRVKGHADAVLAALADLTARRG